MANTPKFLDVSHLAAYAEDPRSYCFYKGKPRSLHDKKTRKKKPRINHLGSGISRGLLFLSLLFLLLVGWSLWVAPEDIYQTTLTQLQLWKIAGISATLAVIFWWLRAYFLRRKLFKISGVPISSYKLVGNTLMWPRHSIKLKKDNLFGVPSTIFLKKNGESVYVSHFNPRIFNGRVKVRERYQLLLFMGMAMEKYDASRVKGSIHYQDHLEPIKFEPVIYKKLIELQDEYHEAIRAWEAPNVRPLFNREQAL